MENGVGLQLCVKYEEDDEPEEEDDDKEDEKLETPPTAPPLPLPNIIAICIFLAEKKCEIYSAILASKVYWVFFLLKF